MITEYCQTPLRMNEIILKYSKIYIEKSMQNEILMDNKTPLQLAVLFHVPDAVALLLDHPLTKTETAHFLYPFTPLFLAIKFSYMDILELLLNHTSTNLNQPFPGLGYTSLTLAMEYGHEEIIQLLKTKNHSSNRI